MNRVKCSACGFVAFSTEETCKKCKRNMSDSSAGSKTAAHINHETQTEGSITWSMVIVGLLMIGGAVFLYNVFDNFEKEGGSVRMPAIAILMYKIGGKWLVSIFVALMGILVTAGGFTSGSDEEEN